MKNLTIEFRTKPQEVYYGETLRRYVKVPELTTRHCDMNAFRCSRRFGSYANSTLFSALLARAVKAMGIENRIWEEQTIAGVEIDKTGFLWVVKITLQDL
jgi:hypothetical protein